MQALLTVLRLTVADMLDSDGKMHGACIIHMVDMYVR